MPRKKQAKAESTAAQRRREDHPHFGEAGFEADYLARLTARLDFQAELENGPSVDEIRALRALRLIWGRDKGAALSPVENFICEVVDRYQRADSNGKGLRLEKIESMLADLRDSMSELIPAAHFLAGRYPAPR